MKKPKKIKEGPTIKLKKGPKIKLRDMKPVKLKRGNKTIILKED